MVRPDRFERPAFWFVARRSIQLSYGRILRRDDNQNSTIGAEMGASVANPPVRIKSQPPPAPLHGVAEQTGDPNANAGQVPQRHQ